MNDQFSKDAPVLANVGVQNIWPTPCISAAGSQDLLWEWSSSACHARLCVWVQSEAGHSPSLARAWCWPVWPFGTCSPPISSPCAQLACVPSSWPLLRTVLAATLYLRSSCSVWLHSLPGINKWYYSEKVFFAISFLSIGLHTGAYPPTIYYTHSCLSQRNSAAEAQLVHQLQVVDPTAWPAFALPIYGTGPIRNRKS